MEIEFLIQILDFVSVKMDILKNLVVKNVSPVILLVKLVVELLIIAKLVKIQWEEN